MSRSVVAVGGDQRPSLLSVNAYHYNRGGADNVYLSHGELFADYGWRTSWSSMHHEQNLPCEDSLWFAEEVDLTARKDVGRRILEGKRIIYSGEARNKLRGLLDTRHIDVAHVHSIYHHQSPSLLLELKSRGIPVVLTAHDLKLACPSYTMLNSTGVCERCKGGRVWNVARYRCIKGSLAGSTLIMLESAIHKALRLYDRNVDVIVTPSIFYRTKLIEWGWDPEKIVHVRNFVPLNVDSPPFSMGNHVLYFGRLSHEKGLATLIRAAARSGVAVKIAGRGPEEGALRKLVEELAAPVEFLGFLGGDELWSAVDQSRAVVLPSEWYENGPMSAIEAFGRGKPLIGADIGGIPELIIEGQTGWSFRSGDVDDLAKTLDSAMSIGRKDLEHMSFSAQDIAHRDYSADKYYERILSIYEGLLPGTSLSVVRHKYKIG
jgi:glycosyltransferase involved in cell wall biosynthesis